MNIFHINPNRPGIYGGKEVMVREWIKNYHEAHNVHVLLQYSGKFQKDLECLGAKVLVLKDINARNFASMLNSLAAYVKEQKIDILHSADQFGHLIGGLLKMLTGRPEVFYLHGVIQVPRRLRYVTLIPADVIAVASKPRIREVARLPRIGGRITEVPLGIDLTLFSRNQTRRDKFRKTLAIERKKVFLLPSRITEGKGQELLIQTLLSHQNELPADCFFLLVGDCADHNYVAYLKSKAKPLIDKGSLQFEPSTADILSYYDASDGVLFPSFPGEAFGLVPVEAMAMKKLVLASRISGPSVVIRDNETGLLFQPQDPIDLWQKLKVAFKLLNSPEAERMGCRARKSLIGKYDIQHSTGCLERLYASLVATKQEAN